MKRPSNKLIVSGVAVVGIVVLVAAAFSLKPVILEQWYIWKLESEDKAIRVAAAEKLADIGSVRAVPHLIQAIETMENENSWDAIGGGPPHVRTGIVLTPIAYSLYRIGPDVLPAVRRAYEEEVASGRSDRRYCLLLRQIEDSVTTTSLYVRKGSMQQWGPPRNIPIDALLKQRRFQREPDGSIDY